MKGYKHIYLMTFAVGVKISLEANSDCFANPIDK